METWEQIFYYLANAVLVLGYFFHFPANKVRVLGPYCTTRGRYQMGFNSQQNCKAKPRITFIFFNDIAYISGLILMVILHFHHPCQHNW